MIYIGLFLLEMYLLYLLSNKVNATLFTVSKKFLRSHKISMYLMSLILLPGTFIHETAHFLTAKILLVPVSNFSLKPKLIKNNILLGCVTMQKTDIFRSFLIGGAPVIYGLAIMYVAFYFVPIEKALQNAWIALAMIILTFQISNTMYSSSKDMEGALVILIITALLIAVIFFFKDYIPMDAIILFIGNPVNTEIIRQISLYLLIPIITNSLFAYFASILIN